MSDDDDDEEEFGGMFEGGHWLWDESTQGLVFTSEKLMTRTDTVVHIAAPTGRTEFRDNVDLIEQIRFRRRFQRQLLPGQAAVVTLQDLKDIALFTAPMSIMSVKLINMMHTVTAERFMRAITFYIQYYLQVAAVMTSRMKELEVKLRSPQSADVECVYRDNLSDLRVLVAKEYSIMIIGGGDVRKYHHMGAAKKRRSLSDVDARLVETLLRMCVQIVWLAMGRKSFNQIELEIHRLFKSETFNMIEHDLKTDYIAKMAAPERTTLLGRCNRPERKLKIRSPMMKDVFCHDVDFRMTALGVAKMTGLTARLHYIECAVAAPEEALVEAGVTVGIIGMDRGRFDTTLNEIKIPAKGDEKSRASMASMPASSRSISRSSGGLRKSAMSVRNMYPEIKLPPKDDVTYIPERFPSAAAAASAGFRASTEAQRRRWVQRFTRLSSVRRSRSQASSGPS